MFWSKPKQAKCASHLSILGVPNGCIPILPAVNVSLLSAHAAAVIPYNEESAFS